MSSPADRRRVEAERIQQLADRVEAKVRRKLAARADRSSVWFGLGMFGLVGWSVALPTLLGLFAGHCADMRWHGRVSWTLTGLLAGVSVGCANAWFWVLRESRR